MDDERRKAKKNVIGLFLLCLCIAFACFGICVYMVLMYRGGESADESISTIAYIIVLVGILFLVLAFGYLLPTLISHKKRENQNAVPNLSEPFEETNMRQVLGGYIPDGETLLAGIRAISKEMIVKTVLGKCVRTENGLIPNENGGIIAINKEKYSTFDIYIGITQYSMVIAQCERNSYYYQFKDVANVNEADIHEVTSPILLADIGTCFRLADIQSCKTKEGWMGSVKCFIKMKNGSYFKLIFPKHGGLSGGMPHHTEYRKTIIMRLSGSNI